MTTDSSDCCDYVPFQEEEDTCTTKQAKQPKKNAGDTTLAMPLLGAFKTHSMVIGLLVGFFVQFSTLGANFLVIALWETNLHEHAAGISESATTTTDITMAPRTKSEIILLSLLWSAFTSFMAILTLGFLRSVITIIFQATLPPHRRGLPDTDAILDEVILHLECRFVVGALVGVCLAWTVTDLILGMNLQILFSFITLTISLAWCKLMMHCFTKDVDETTLMMMQQETADDDDDYSKEEVTLLIV
jgi:hypothetical protein